MCGGFTSNASGIGSTTACGEIDLTSYRFGRQNAGTDLPSKRLTPNHAMQRTVESGASLAFSCRRWRSLGVTVDTAQQEMQVITVFTTFTLPRPITREEARRIFLSTAPRYRGVQGLFQKIYLLSQDGVTVGGVYLWNSRSEAEAMYTESWRSFVREKYGTVPTVTYFESPVVVDNVTQQVLTDD